MRGAPTRVIYLIVVTKTSTSQEHVTRFDDTYVYRCIPYVLFFFFILDEVIMYRKVL
jgi:hypothetical protein